MDDMDYYEWEAAKNRSKLSKVLRFLVKALAAFIIIGTFSILIARMTVMNVPNAFKDVTLTAGIKQSIDSNSFDAIGHEPYSAFDKEGWYHLSNIALSESAGEVQMTVRYNTRSTINDLMSLYKLSERPSGELFVYVLYDGNGNAYTDYTYAAASRPMYEFRRVVFTGVDLTDVSALYLDVHYISDLNGKMSKSFVIYDSAYPSDIYTPKDVKGDSLEFSDAPIFFTSSGEDN